MDIKEYKVIVTPKAYREISRIYEYISEDLYAKKAAINLINLIEKSIKYLKYEPKRYKEIEGNDDLRRKYRKIVIKNYILLYTIDESNKIVYVAHIYYGRRDYFKKI